MNADRTGVIAAIAAMTPPAGAITAGAITAGAIALCLVSPAHAIDWEGEDASASLITHARTYTLLLYDPSAAALRRSLGDLGVPEATIDGLPGTDTEQAAVVERFRFVLDARVGERWSAAVHYDLLPIFGTFETEGFFTAAQNPLRLWDLDRALHTDDDWTVSHAIDRAVIHYTAPAFEVRLGRQAIGFGGARLFNAADLFAPLGPASIDSEFKGGVDAVQLIAPLGELHEVALIAVANRHGAAESHYLVRWRGMFDGFDIGALLGSTYGLPTAALEAAGDLGGSGWYLEASARIDPDGYDHSAVRATAGLDHHFPIGLRLIGELHYNSPGTLDPADTPAALQRQPYTVGEVYLLGELYAGLLASYELHPLATLNLSWLQNLTDGSALAGPAIAWDFAQEVSLGAGALIPIGPSLDFGPAGLPTVRSEFGLYPTVFYTDLRLAL